MKTEDWSSFILSFSVIVECKVYEVYSGRNRYEWVRRSKGTANLRLCILRWWQDVTHIEETAFRPKWAQRRMRSRLGAIGGKCKPITAARVDVVSIRSTTRSRRQTGPYTRTLSFSMVAGKRILKIQFSLPEFQSGCSAFSVAVEQFATLDERVCELESQNQAFLFIRWT
jgi:hypothetical protein